MNGDWDSLLGAGDINPSTSSDYLDHIEIRPTTEEPPTTPPPSKLPQLWCAFSASLAALSAGLVLGWTSPIFEYLTKGKFYHIPINQNQMGWIGSFATLGAMAMCIPTGFICDLIGRKMTLRLLIVPFLCGWALIIWAQNIYFLYVGRIITGMAVGASCIAVPLYNGEISHRSIRGALGSLFQLMIITGIFVGYLFGEILSPELFTKICAAIPVLFLISTMFIPETPTFLIKRGNFDEARSSLAFLRGKHYDVDHELLQIEGSFKHTSHVTISLRQTFRKKSIIKAVIITTSLMFFQQFSGINVIILYSSNIFKETGIELNSNLATIIVGAMQVLATLCASLIIEKTGRKRLLFISLSAVTFSVTILGIYFSLMTRGHPNAEVLKDISFMPIGAVCLFTIAFSIGLGPIPWMISSEIVPTEIRSIVGSTAGTFNWFLAFVITKSYLTLSTVLGCDNVFYVFAIVSFIGTIFVILIVPETKGKSVHEIQEELN